ncbi:MAG: FkbM family methyltransferase [Rhizomicrobium sp.]
MIDDNACAELFRIGSRGGGAFPEPGDLFESIIEDIYTALLKPGDLALDGGAHVGRHAFPMAERVGSEGLVLAVEAHPKLARGLVRRAKKRRLGQAQVVERALYNRIARVPFHCVARHSAYSGIEARRFDFKDSVRAIEVEATTIDALLSARPERNWRFCKLDLEGGELRALQGGVAALGRFRPLVVFENDQENSARDYGYSKDEWFGFFETTGYEVFTLWGRAYGRKDWGRRDIPWYFIAASANSPESDFIGSWLPALLSRYL